MKSSDTHREDLRGENVSYLMRNVDNSKICNDMQTTWFTVIEGVESGPFKLEELQELYSDKKIGLETVLIRASGPGSKSVTRLKDLLDGERQSRHVKLARRSIFRI